MKGIEGDMDMWWRFASRSRGREKSGSREGRREGGNGREGKSKDDERNQNYHFVCISRCMQGISV